MPVGRPCPSHGFSFQLCDHAKAHGKECMDNSNPGYRSASAKTKKEACTGFVACDPFAECRCQACQKVLDLATVCYKCPHCGEVDSSLTKMDEHCPSCKKWDWQKMEFLSKATLPHRT